MSEYIEVIPKIPLSEVFIKTHSSNVDCMTNQSYIIEMVHLPTGKCVYCEYGRESGAFYRGYLLAHLEQVLQKSWGEE